LENEISDMQLRQNVGNSKSVDFKKPNVAWYVLLTRTTNVINKTYLSILTLHEINKLFDSKILHK